MNLEEALKTAIEYENRVTQVYQEAERIVTDPAGRRFFEVLAGEEQGHVSYLTSRLDEWRRTGHVTAETLQTAIPARFQIEEGLGRLAGKMKETGRDSVGLDLLKRALAVEAETSAFYHRMVRELPEEGQRLFERFLEIEEGHGAIVQAEIDALNGTGYWFDVREFELEGA